MMAQDSIWLAGLCHVHAMAAVAAHGGHYAALLDHAVPWSTDEDGETIHPGVVHVWSVHATPQGAIWRDITGDHRPEDARRAALERWNLVEEHGWGDAAFDDRVTAEELASWCEEDGPLYQVDAHDLTLAVQEGHIAPSPAWPTS